MLGELVKEFKFKQQLKAGKLTLVKVEKVDKDKLYLGNGQTLPFKMADRYLVDRAFSKREDGERVKSNQGELLVLFKFGSATNYRFYEQFREEHQMGSYNMGYVSSICISPLMVFREELMPQYGESTGSAICRILARKKDWKLATWLNDEE